MNLKKTTLQLLFLFCGIVSAQSQNQGTITAQQERVGGHLNTIKAKYDIEFNLPQFDITFTIPANTTFKLPKMVDEDVALEIGKESYYSFDLKYLDEFSTRTIRFFESYQDKDPVMFLEIRRYDKELVQFLEKNQRQHPADYYRESQTDEEKGVAPIVSKLGTSVVQVLKDDDDFFIVHSFFKDGCGYHFYLDQGYSAETQSRYVKIIESIAPKNLFQKRKQYENRVKYNFYKLEKHPKLPSEGVHKFDFYKGTTSRDNIAVNLLEETEMRIPANTEYMIEANSVEEVGADSLLVYVDKNDFINNKRSSETYFMKDFNMIVSSVMSLKDIDTYVKQLSDNYDVSKSVVAVMGEIPLYIYYYGSKDQGTIDLYIKTGESAFLNLRVYGYSKKTKDAIHQVLSTFKFKGVALPYLDGAIELEKGDDIEFTEIILPDPDMINASKFEMMDLGVTAMLPGEMNEYKLSRNQKTAKMSSSGILMKAKPTDRMGLSLYKEGSPFLFYVGLSEMPENMDEALQDLVRSWGSNKAISDIEAGRYIANNIRWNIMIYKLGDVYYSTAITFVEDCLIAVYVNNVKTKQEIIDNLAYIRTFKFGKPLKKGAV